MFTINNRRFIWNVLQCSPTGAVKYGSKPDVKTKIQIIRQNIKSYTLNKYIDYIKNYDKVLEVKFPRAMHVYRVFAIGIKDFYNETKELVRVRGLAKSIKKEGNGIYSLTSKEIDIYYRMPREMWRVAPVLLVSALPLANYVVFPLAYIFPKYLLSSHFWSLQQRNEFALQDHIHNLHYFKPTFRAMQARISSVDDENLRFAISTILSKLASGVHPTVQEIIGIKVLFQGEPFHLNCLYPHHKNCVLRIHGMHTLWSRRHRLQHKALEIYNADRALEREGVASLSSDDLRWACFTRGLNPSNMRSDDICQWLDQWITVSAHVDSSTLSLLLHCPILLAYNEPTNRIHMH